MSEAKPNAPELALFHPAAHCDCPDEVMAATAPGNRNAEAFDMLTPAILAVAWINQATAWWAVPWLALPRREALHGRT